MHYEVNGLTVRTENAAKPLGQAHAFVLHWIGELLPTSVVLDYGCGKFRYTIPLARHVKNVVAVDSKHQVDRIQIVAGEETSLRSYAADHLPNTQVYDITQKAWLGRRYDIVLCANVLSTIPFPRKRRSILRKLRDVLKPRGRLLLCTQYRNTYFKTYATNPQASEYEDGWLIRSRHGTAFYGIIDKTALVELCDSSGLAITEAFSKGESAYVVASRR